MSNVVKIYNDLSDVGNHENHIKKIGIFTKKCGKREKLLKCFYGWKPNLVAISNWLKLASRYAYICRE